jgi:hypothetical protein
LKVTPLVILAAVVERSGSTVHLIQKMPLMKTTTEQFAAAVDSSFPYCPGSENEINV